MPNKRLVRSRIAAFTAQRGLCHYCLLPIWLDDEQAFCAKYNLTPGELRLRRCTAEHLRARQDGGSDSPSNVVAACLKCNQGRHARKVPLDPDPFRRYVQSRLLKGGWHPAWVVRALRAESGLATLRC